MYTRAAAILIAIVVLLGLGWKAHVTGIKAGRAEVQQRWDAERTQVALAAAAESEARRAKETELTASLERVRAEYAKQKDRDAAAIRATADRLREFQAAIAARDSQAGASATPATGDNGPFATIAGECGRAIVEVDAYARRMAATARALQEYAAGMRLKAP